jgi:hypothetical protein
MALTHSSTLPGHEFDNFLFAPIGEEKSGVPLSVVSALARLNLDPWQEAADLARLPEGAATARMAALIMALPDTPSALQDPGTIAARLIAHLPARPGSNAFLPKMSSGNFNPTTVQSQPVLFAALLLIALLGSLGLAQSQRAVTHGNNSIASAEDGTIQQPPSSIGGPERPKVVTKADIMTNQKIPVRANDRSEPKKPE